MNLDPSRRQFLASTAVLPLGACGGGETLDATISLEKTPRNDVISPLLFGSNLQWTGAGDGTLTPDGSGAFSWNPSLGRLINEAGLTLLRFPGGALANTYRWRNGVGPRSSRAPGLNFIGRPEPSVFGSDELIELANRTKAQLLITANASAGADEAADWVEYLNGGPSTPQGALRQHNTGAGPLSAHWWEVGNELYSPKEPGHTTAAAYARTVISFRNAMRRRDPAVRVGAMLEGSFQSAAWMSRVMPELVTWNAAVLDGCAADIDFVSLHFSTPYDTLLQSDSLRELTLAGPLVLRRALEGLRVLLDKAGRQSLPVILSEYTAYYGGMPSPRISGVEGALFDALVLMELMRQPSVVAAANWSLLNNSTFGLIAEDGVNLRPRPSYTVLRLLGALSGFARAQLRIDGPSYAVAAKGNVPAIASTPMLDGVAASISPDRSRLAIVNRSATASVLARLGGGLRVVRGALRSDDGANWSLPVAFAPGATKILLSPGSLSVLDVGS